MFKFKRKLLIILLLGVGFFFKAYFSVFVNKGDILAIAEWSKSLYEQGIKGSYFREGWVYSFPTQPPIVMLAYWISAWLYVHRYFLVVLHNWFRIPPATILVWLAKNPLFFVKLWGILADCLSALVVYLVLKKLKKQTLALWAMIFLLFNPIPFFVSSVWGQIDILGVILAFLAFLLLMFNSLLILSPILLTLGAMIKPTVFVLTPLYFFWVIRMFFNSKGKNVIFFQFLLGGLLSILIVLISFIPFLNHRESFFKQINSIVSRRILPSAKGTSKVATSAFTFFTIFYQIDKTPGSQKLAFLSLDQIGNLFFLIIIITLAIMIISDFRKKKNFSEELTDLCFWAYFLSEGIFLFKTDMAERYFLPGFLFLFLLYFLANSQKIKLAILTQFFVWFINLVSSFYMRDVHFFQVLFRENGYLGTRIFSLLNVFVYFYIIKTYKGWQALATTIRANFNLKKYKRNYGNIS